MWTKSDKHWVFALLWGIMTNVTSPGIAVILTALMGLGHALCALYLGLFKGE